ncbi:putative orphan protein [Pseudoalteromonas translucida]|uniref:Orphan protein n=1 Tax=Pseudoalteromonas translucida (strain TAC 125) TaxID=326442 RepID=Q3IBV4_PSET1|nr:putative orphan protein [Pseudoalteromonas translucida]SJN28878.1 putative orphan protein [Pseudoalteromonas sp. JB197]
MQTAAIASFLYKNHYVTIGFDSYLSLRYYLVCKQFLIFIVGIIN